MLGISSLSFLINILSRESLTIEGVFVHSAKAESRLRYLNSARSNIYNGQKSRVSHHSLLLSTGASYFS
jgi:hypothetical protein